MFVRILNAAVVLQQVSILNENWIWLFDMARTSRYISKSEWRGEKKMLTKRLTCEKITRDGQKRLYVEQKNDKDSRGEFLWKQNC